jgi:hypothetical protein
MPYRYVRILLAVTLATLSAATAHATNPGPPVVTSLFVPVEGDVTEPGTTNVVHLTGEVHILTQAVFDSDTNQWSVSFYGNLVRVRGTAAASGVTYLGVGADTATWVGSNPGPPNSVSLTFRLLALQPPGPPDAPADLPVSFSDFVFAQEAGFEGRLQSVTASFAQ